MSRRLPLLVAAAAAVFALVAAPALAGSPATNVYTEQVPTATGSKSTGGGGGSNTPTSTPAPPVPLSSNAATTLNHKGGKDKHLLKKVATDPALGAVAPLTAASAPIAGASSAWDLGSGPIALFAALLFGAALLVVGGGLQRRRRSI